VNDSYIPLEIIYQTDNKRGMVFPRKPPCLMFFPGYRLSLCVSTLPDKRVITQQKQIETLEQQVKELEKKIEQMKEVDMNLKEKKKSFSKIYQTQSGILY
jgi:hypothetical protein